MTKHFMTTQFMRPAVMAVLFFTVILGQTVFPVPRDILQEDLNQKLIYFSINGYRQGIMEVLKKGADPNARDHTPGCEGETPLMKAVLNNDIRTSRLLLKNKADVNAVDEQGESALLIAAYFGYEELTHLLVEKGADVNLKSKSGISPLFIAADRDKVKIVNYLLPKGARAEPLKSGYNILMATAKDAPELLTLFLKKGLNPNSASKQGKTAVMEAACANNPQTMEILSRFGANLRQRDNKGRGLLYYLFLCNGMYRYDFRYQKDILRFILKKDPGVAKRLSDARVFQDVIDKVIYDRDAAKNDEGLIREFIKEVNPEVINGPGWNGYTVMDNLYSWQSHYKKEHWLIRYLKEKGAKAPHKNIILDFKQFQEKLGSRYGKKVSPEQKKEFLQLLKKYGATEIGKLIPTGFTPNKYFLLLLNAGVYPESLFDKPEYVPFLIAHNKEDILLQYYEKNFSLAAKGRKSYIDTDKDGVYTDFNSFSYYLFLCGSKRVAEKMIEKKDPNLDSGRFVSILMGTYDPILKQKLQDSIEKFKLILQYKASNLKADVWKYLPPEIVQHQYIRWLLLMMKYPFDKKITDKQGNSLIHLLLKKYKDFEPLNEYEMQALKELVKAGVGVNSKNKDGDTPLILAARNGQYSAVKYLLENGAGINVKNNYSENALYAAMVNRHESVVQYLLDQGARKDILGFFDELQKNKKLNTALLKKYGLSYSPALNHYVNLYGYSLQMDPFFLRVSENNMHDCSAFTLVKNKDTVLLKYLLKNGFSANCLHVHSVKDFSYIEGTPLDAAIREHHPELVRLLLEYGADPMYVDRWGKGYLDYDYFDWDKTSSTLIRQAQIKIKQNKQNKNRH